jgi:hypothetical protein
LQPKEVGHIVFELAELELGIELEEEELDHVMDIFTGWQQFGGDGEAVAMRGEVFDEDTHAEGLEGFVIDRARILAGLRAFAIDDGGAARNAGPTGPCQ